jgi:predicted PurR-regulated permease PerM
MPVDVRSLSLALLAVFASIYALRAASAVFIPLLLGLTMSYALSPIVDRMQRLRVPRAVGAALLLAALSGGLGLERRRHGTCRVPADRHAEGA